MAVALLQGAPMTDWISVKSTCFAIGPTLPLLLSLEMIFVVHTPCMFPESFVMSNWNQRIGVLGCSHLLNPKRMNE